MAARSRCVRRAHGWHGMPASTPPAAVRSEQLSKVQESPLATAGVQGMQKEIKLPDFALVVQTSDSVRCLKL